MPCTWQHAYTGWGFQFGCQKVHTTLRDSALSFLQLPLSSLTSGAAQAKVPTQYSVDRNCCCMILARPTSAILAVKSLDSSMLADFRSKCTIFLVCRKCRPRAVSRAIRLPSPGLEAPVIGSLQHQIVCHTVPSDCCRQSGETIGEVQEQSHGAELCKQAKMSPGITL